LVARYANGVKLILSRKQACWSGVSGQRFDGTEGWIADSAGEHEQTRCSSPALLGEVATSCRPEQTRPRRPRTAPARWGGCLCASDSLRFPASAELVLVSNLN
jgi:hypothetical protein